MEDAMKTSIFIAAIFISFIAAGCSTTTYLSLTEVNEYQIRFKIVDYEQDENEGVEVTFTIQNGREINGELLSVRDSSVTICIESSATEEELASLKYPINTVRYDEIKELTIEGSSYVWTGIIIGYVVGGIIGYYIGQSGVTSDRMSGFLPIAGMLLGTPLGLTVGGIIGYELSTEEYVLQEIPPGYNMTFLKRLARYPYKEPEYLRAIK